MNEEMNEASKDDCQDESRRIVFIKYNYGGERRWRRVLPDPDMPLVWGATQKEWLLRARDMEDGSERLFSMCAIHEWRSTWP
jgi:hypothetical protein